LRDLLLGAHETGEGADAGAQHGAGGKGRRREARHLVHARGHAQIDTAVGRSHADVDGQVYKVPHFDAKGEANDIFTELGVPTTFLLTSFYWDNFINFGMGPKKGADGKLAITFPLGTKKLASIAAEDIGKVAYAIFEKGEEMIGKTVGVAGGHLSGAQMAKSFTKALGQEVRYNAVTPAAYSGFGFPGADDLANMFQFNSEFEQDCCDARNISETKSLNPELMTFDRWLAQNKSRIPPG